LGGIRDRVGIGWRGELAAGILGNLDRVDLVEVIAEDWWDLPRDGIRALRTLGAQVPVWIHGVSLGLASTAAADPRRLDRMARLVDLAAPEGWSEHLAFVRGGGVEIGHLAAPPRNGAVLDGLARNAGRARRLVGSAPLLENVATLLEPPGSDRDEAAFTAAAAGAGAGLLLDLHNLHANAVNFGFDGEAFLDRIPLERVGMVHVAGGRWIRSPGGRRRLLDDHLHPVPEEVWSLLESLAARAERPLAVVLERDGAYPAVEALLGELDRARAALRRGRARRAVPA
jgi:uncharacterized protein (UPF0276 family)